MEKMEGFVESAKEMPGFLGVSWRRNVLLFPGAARIIGEKNERRDSHDLPVYDENADDGSHCFHF